MYRNKITVGDLQMFLCKYKIEDELIVHVDLAGHVFVNVANLTQRQVPLKLVQTESFENDAEFLKKMGIQA